MADINSEPQADAFDQQLNSYADEPQGPNPITAYDRPEEAQGGGTAPTPDDGFVGAGIRGVADAASFGFGDEIGGFFDTIGLPDAAGTKYETIWNSSKGFSANLAANIAHERAFLANDAERHAVAHYGGEVVGSLAIPFGAGARGALQVAKVGAIQGAIAGFGGGTDVTSRIEGAAKGGAIGGAVGALLGRFLPGLKAKGAESGDNVATTTTSYPSREPRTVAAPDGTIVPSHLEDGAELTGFSQSEAGASVPHYEAPKAPEETVPLEAPPRTPDGEPTLAGSIPRSQLTALQQDVANFREAMTYGGDRQADITHAATPEAAAQVGEFRIGNLGEQLDTAALISALARKLPSVGRKSDEELANSAMHAAGSIGEDPEAMLSVARDWAGRLGDADNVMMALRSVWAMLAKQITDIHLAGVDWAQADDEIVAQAGQAIRNLSELSQSVQIAKVGLGRGLRVNQLPDAETYLQSLLGKTEGASATATDKAPKGAFPGDKMAVGPVGPRQMSPLPRNRGELKDWFDLWGMHANNPKGQSDFLQGLLTVPTPGKYLRTSFANFFTASILSAPRTIAMNVVGPALISLVRNMERFGGAAAGALNPLATAEERAAMREVARQTPSAYIHMWGDIGDAWRAGVQSFEQNKSIIGGGSSTTDALSTYGPLTNNLLGAAGADPNRMYALGNLINVWPKAFARVNNGLDEMAKRLSYMGEVRVRAQVEAAGQGLSGEDMQQFVRDKLKASFDEAGHAADSQLLRSAERNTFTSQVGEEGTHLRKIANQIQGIRRDIPEMRYIVPVFNVPANALGETMRRIPLANRLLGSHAADLAGDNGVVAQAEAHGRTLLGASFLMAGVMMNRAGILTGAGPQEPTDRKIWLQTHQPYSIRVGDEWVRYDKFDILGGLLSIPSTISDATTYRPVDQGAGDMIASGAGALAQWFKDRASMKTAAAILNAGSDPTSDFGTVMQQFIGSTSAGFIPAAFRSLTVDTTDPYVRMRRDWGDYMKASLPFLSQQLEPTRNVLGEPIQRPQDTFGEALFPVTMQSAVTYKTDPVMDELARIYETTGYGAGADPKSLGYGFFNPKDVKLEDGRSIYDRAMQMRQTLQLEGKTLRQSLGDLIASPAYLHGVDADSGQKVTSLGDASRGYMVRQIFDRYNKAAKSTLAQQSPTAERYLTAAAAKNTDDAYLRDLSVEDLVKTPRLYQDRGINANAYSEKLKGGGQGDPLLHALGL